MSRIRSETRLVCLPCQPSPAARGKRLLHHGGGIDKNLDVAAGGLDQPAPKLLQPRLDHLVIVVAARIDRNAAAHAVFQDRQRIVVRAVIDAEHDDRTHLRPHRARIAAARGIRPPSSPCRRGRRRRETRATVRAISGMESGCATPTASKPCARAASASAALSAAGVRNRDWRSSATAAGRPTSPSAACGTTGAI